MNRRETSIILEAVTTGAAYTREHNPHLPFGPAHALRDFKACYDAGARAFHWHARDTVTGVQTADEAQYRSVLEGLREQFPGVPATFATSRKSLEHVLARELMRLDAMEPEKAGSLEHVLQAERLRLGGLYATPCGLTTITPMELPACRRIRCERLDEALKSYSELNRTTWRDPEVIRQYLALMKDYMRPRGMFEALEITTSASWDLVQQIADDPLLGLSFNTRWVLLLGFSSQLGISREEYEDSVSRAVRISEQYGIKPHITLGSVIPPAMASTSPGRRAGETLPPGRHDIREVIEWVAQDDRVQAFRAGIEDTPQMYGRTPTNAELIGHAHSVFEELGVTVEQDIRTVRKRFGLGSTTLQPSIRLAS